MSTTIGSRTGADLPLQPPVSAPAVPRSAFRPDIEGLRAVAVVLVVLSHAGMTTFSGGYVGVDVFFVISGFLITTLLVKELSRTGTISLAGFYARRATRLLPASTVVLVATVAASYLWLPATRFASISLDALYTTFYGINWRLASEGIDYLNAEAAPSPLQHFWSLAVEEQFYLVWPLLLLVVAWLWRRHNTANRLPIIVALLVIVVASLAVSVHQTTAAAPWAYFGAHTRAWELGIGALVAMGTAALTRTHKVLAAALTWGGLGAVVVAALVFDDSTAFPGYAAALPVLGTAAIIAGGSATPRGGAGLLLGTWPFQQIGKLSYGWYLWHWPVLMIAPTALGVDPTVPVNLLLAGGALLLALVSYHLVENPVRTWKWIKSKARRGLAVGLTLSAAAAAFALVAGMHTPSISTGSEAPNVAAALTSAADPEAELIKLVAAAAGERKLPDNLTPKITKARSDRPAFYNAGCHLDYNQVQPPDACTFGDVNGKQTMYLMGDSHAAHWFPTLDIIAKQRQWRLVALTKSSCQIQSVAVYDRVLKRQYDECIQWRNLVLDRIRAERPAMVVFSGGNTDSGGLLDAQGNRIPSEGFADDDLWVQGWMATINRVKSPDTTVVMIQDTPWPDGNAPECASQHPRDLKSCARPVTTALLEPNRRDLVAAAARADGVTVIDPAPWLCAATCPIVVGNILVYKDNSHMSTPWAKALAPILATKLK